MKPNPFFLSRNHGSHLSGDRIEFAAHINRSLSIPEAIDLCAHLAILIDDDHAVRDQIHVLRGKKLPTPEPPTPTKAVKKESDDEEADESAADALVGDAPPAAEEPVARKRPTRRSHAA